MAVTTLTFTEPLNVSCQVGDTAYYVPTSTSGGFSVNSSSITEIGVITSISGLVVVVGNSFVATVPVGAFILFSKDNKANMSSALGYYAEVKMKNTGTIEAELFSVAVDMFESSK
tara:strand:- start:6519 stop:6863 length:345 start_codon:yes stop_codon:yes gene_type:complete